MIKKILLSVLAMLSGPALVLASALVYDWSLYGAIGTACAVSFIAIQKIWSKTNKSTA